VSTPGCSLKWRSTHHKRIDPSEVSPGVVLHINNGTACTAFMVLGPHTSEMTGEDGWTVMEMDPSEELTFSNRHGQVLGHGQFTGRNGVLYGHGLARMHLPETKVAE
jgi:hypothetical protein